MYHWIEDKGFLKRMRTECSDVVNRLVQSINNEGYLQVNMHMVGSGAKNLETQNANEPIDLDYNINILNIDGDITDCLKIKEYIHGKLDGVLREKDGIIVRIQNPPYQRNNAISNRETILDSALISA